MTSTIYWGVLKFGMEKAQSLLVAKFAMKDICRFTMA